MYGWATVVTAFSLFKLCNSATIRESSEVIQQVTSLVIGCFKKKEYDIDYASLVSHLHSYDDIQFASCLPLPADYQHVLEHVTSQDIISLTSVVFLSEISDNTMNSQKGFLLYDD